MGIIHIAPILLVLGVYIPMDADISHYCPCSLCCGEYASGITASGERVREGIVAADKRFAFGTEIVIDGRTYTVEDRGGAINGNKLDVYCNSHTEALQKGRVKKRVYVKIAPQDFARIQAEQKTKNTIKL